MKPPACDLGDFCMAQRAESTLFIPEIAVVVRFLFGGLITAVAGIIPVD